MSVRAATTFQLTEVTSVANHCDAVVAVGRRVGGDVSGPKAERGRDRRHPQSACDEYRRPRPRRPRRIDRCGCSEVCCRGACLGDPRGRLIVGGCRRDRGRRRAGRDILVRLARRIIRGRVHGCRSRSRWGLRVLPGGERHGADAFWSDAVGDLYICWERPTAAPRPERPTCSQVGRSSVQQSYRGRVEKFGPTPNFEFGESCSADPANA